MGLLIKFLLKNILEKKLRTFLIVFSVTISAALFFASISLTGTAMNIYITQIQSAFGKSEIVIQPNDRSPSQYFNVALPPEYLNNIDYTIGVVESSAVYRYRKDQAVIFNAKGVDWEDIKTMSPIVLKKEAGLFPFTGKKVIVSSYAAQKYSLQTGQILELDINQNRYRFIIAAIANPTGLFTRDTNLIIIPKAKLSSICSQLGNVSKLYVKLKDPAVKSQFIKGLSRFITRYDVRETISEQQFRERTEIFEMSLNMTLMIVFLLSIFIIFTSFKVITAERLPVIGTFRSVGADKKTTDLILMTEAGIMGIIGGVVGLLLGFGALYLMATAIAETPGGGTTAITLTFNIFQVLTAFLMAVLLSVGSSAVPIYQVSKLPVKDIILNTVQKRELNPKKWRLIIGIAFILITLFLPQFLDGDIGMIIDSVLIGLAIVACLLLVPFVTPWLMKILENLYVHIFGNIGTLAVKNLRGNRNLQNSIVLIAIGISTVMMVSILGRSIVTGLTNFSAQTLNYDLTFVLPKMDRSIELSARSTVGVKSVYGLYSIQNIVVVGSTERITQIDGVDNQFPDFKRITSLSGDLRQLIKKLNYGRNIIVSNLIRNKFGLKLGDTLTLRLNNKERPYKVIGFIDTLEGDGGSYALISKRYFKADTRQTYFNELAVQTTTSPASVLKSLLNKFSRNTPSGFTAAEFQKILMDEVGGILIILDGFSLLTALIGLIGLINNLIINFIERKRSLAILRSIGSTRKQTVQLIIIEAATSGIIGTAIGMFTGFVMVLMIPHYTRAMMATIPASYSPATVIIIGTAGVLVTLLASTSPAFRSSKLNIIESIKYE